MLRLRLITLLVLFAAFPAAWSARAQAQDADDTDFLRRWVDAQIAHAEAIDTLSFRERAVLTLDSPFGQRRFEYEARVTGRPGEMDWHRTFGRARVNGRPLPMDRWRRRQPERNHMMGVPIERLTMLATLSPRLLQQLRPAGPPVAEPLDGQPMRRVDLVPAREPFPIDRITAWFDADGRRLVRTRAVVRHPRASAPFIVITQYDHLRDLDLPVGRHIEGTQQLRRRMRTFTTLITFDAQYDAYLFR